MESKVLSYVPSQDAVASARGPVVSIHLDAGGRPCGATASQLVNATPETLYATVNDFERFAKHLPMTRKASKKDTRISLEMGFKIAFFSVGQGFTGEATVEEPHAIVVRHVTGEPKGLEMAYQFLPGPRPGTAFLSTGVTFDILSIGWLVKTFLKNHPEIQNGVYPGVVLSMLFAVKEAAGVA